MDNYLKNKVIWVDEDDKVLGEIERGEAHDKELLHRVAAIYLERKNGDILIQERKSGRLDHSSAGHVDPGEAYEAAASREFQEELGICGKSLKEIAHFTSDEFHPKHKHHVRHKYKLYLCEGDKFKIDPEEVKSAFWGNPLEIYKDMQNDPTHEKYTGGFYDSLKYYLKYKGLAAE